MVGLFFLVGICLFAWVVCKLQALSGVAEAQLAPAAAIGTNAQNGENDWQGRDTMEDFLEPPVSDVMNVDTWQTNDVISLRYLTE